MAQNLFDQKFQVDDIFEIRTEKSSPNQYRVIDIDLTYLPDYQLLEIIPKNSLIDTYSSKIRIFSSGQLQIENLQIPFEYKYIPRYSDQKLIQLSCSDLPKILRGKQLATGSEGKIYEWCDNSQLNESKCNYVVKVQDYNIRKIKELEIATSHNNLAFEKGFAPRIHQLEVCSQQGYIFQVMDKFTGPTFNQLLTLAKLNNNLTDQLMKSIRELHQKVGVYHGDMGPRNIYITSSNSIKFIDFAYRKTGYQPYHDFLTLLFYLPRYYSYHPSKIKEYKYLVDSIIKNVESFDPSQFDRETREIINFYHSEAENETRIREFSESLELLSIQVEFIYLKYLPDIENPNIQE